MTLSRNSELSSVLIAAAVAAAAARPRNELNEGKSWMKTSVGVTFNSIGGNVAPNEIRMRREITIIWFT